MKAPLAVLALALSVLPLPAGVAAQPAGGLPRVGVLWTIALPSGRPSANAAGYVDGQSVALE